ncbi:MAG: DUF4197 domain-containing protein [Candidatus Omnitrophica bacterium]|nr:DUF4197 domain-containing protein [Candidatus Omnitrophota bacterium]
MRRSIIVFGAVACLGALASPAHANFSWFKNKLRNLTDQPSGGIENIKLSDTKIGQGLKEALKVGINNTVSQVGRTDGYLKNETIMLRLPEKLRTLEKGLRMVGFDKEVDEFVLSMNRAAENAAPRARDIFLDSLFEMTIEDAQKIYRGDPTAATDYFRKNSYDRLYQSFQPSVQESLEKYDVTAKYQILLDKYASLPLAKKFPAPGIDEYVVNKSLDGLFTVLGEQEQKIRTDPAARVTDLLREVFQ